MEYQARILIVDDNPTIHNDFKKVLCPINIFSANEFKTLERELFPETQLTDEFSTPVYEMDSARQGKEALEMVMKSEKEGRPYAIVFVDLRMPPGWDGIKTISKIWEQYPHIEMVICTAYSDYSWEKIIHRLGTTDQLLFLRKPFDTTAVKQMALSLSRKWKLRREAQEHVSQLEREVGERRRSEEKLKYAIHHDILTELPNRTFFYQTLQMEINKARSTDDKVTVFLIDLDRFKEINDTLGHHNGDKVLKETVFRLKRNLDEKYMLARCGGDEFAICCPTIGKKEAAEMAQNIQAYIKPWYEVDNLQLEIRISIGIVIYPEHGGDADILMRRADMTMANAKNSDSGITFFKKKFDDYSPQRLTLLSELRQAITEKDDIEIHYQPKIDMATGQLCGFEALVRWSHPIHGLLEPKKFIPLAERSGLIKPLSLWILNKVAENWVSWSKSGIHLSVSVNISAKDLLDSLLPQKIIDTLNHHGMDPKYLTIEITESAMMEDPEQAKQILTKLSQIGIKLSIDDFGTGYSSLAYLKHLPVDEIKIDQSFVLDMTESKDNATIVKSTIELGHTLGLEVTAEGIEQEETWSMLQTLGCNSGQGFYMGEPASVSNIEKWMHESPWGLLKRKQSTDSGLKE